jgi:hypothetical protein
MPFASDIVSGIKPLPLREKKKAFDGTPTVTCTTNRNIVFFGKISSEVLIGNSGSQICGASPRRDPSNLIGTDAF